jgi:MFS family permease
MKNHSTSPDTKETTHSIGNELFFWIASMLAFGAMCVMLPTAFMLDRVGRKLTMLSAAPLLCISFLIVGASFNAYAWMVGRFVMGFAGAALGVAGPIFIGEIAQHDICGTLSCLFQLLLVTGIAAEYTLGLTENLSVVGRVSAAFPFNFFVIFIFIPETPTFL